jgi:hypothetical protein
MPDALESLLDSLLYEGYALYPYTPDATKNATPTPFGIVYPPAYAESLPTAHASLELRCVALAPPDALLGAEVHFLTCSGERHEAQAHRVELRALMLGALARQPAEQRVTVPGGDRTTLAVLVRLSARMLAAGEFEASLLVENETPAPGGLDRRDALRRSLLSTHPVLRLTGGRLISPLERPCGSINTFPVLAVDDDTAMIGAAIMLPDHPKIAPESRGGLFDSTEIEEALLLHVQALSDAERAEIAGADPTVRAIVARAATATPDDLRALHGRIELRDPPAQEAPRSRETLVPPSEPDWLPDPRAGEAVAEIRGHRLSPGMHVTLRPGPDADLHARSLDGRRATLERIFTAYDGRVHLGVTIDDDPGQDLMRDTGRYLYFFAEEIEFDG